MATLPTFYNEKYFVNFSSAPDDNGEGTDYRISLLLREARQDLFPDPVELQGGPSTFVLSLGNDDDPLVTTRVATAQISFFDDISLSNLLPSDATEWQVRLLRLNDNKQIYIGYLTAEVYTQPAIEGPNVVTVNAVSPLIPILAEAMPLRDKGQISIGELLKMAISEVKGISEVYIPAMYSLSFPLVSSQFTDILRLTLSPAMYVKQNNLATLTGSEYDYSVFAEPIEALCKLFGWSLVDVGDGALYFISPGYEGGYMRLTADDLIKTSAFSPTIVQPSIFDEGVLMPIDASDTVETRQGYGSATVNVNATDVNISIPSVEEGVQEQQFRRNIATYTEDDKEKVIEIAAIDTLIKHPRIETFKYKPTGSLNNTSFEAVTGYMDSSSLGLEFRKFEWVDSEDLKITAEERKRSWSLQPAYYVREKVTAFNVPDSVVIPSNLPLLKLTAGTGYFSSGAICVNANILAIAGTTSEGFYIPKDGEYVAPKMEKPKTAEWAKFWSPYNKYILCSLRVGNHWWSGARWITTQTTFYLSVSTADAQWHPLVSNKNVDMLYEDSDGVYFPILDPIAGEIELTLYRTEVADRNELISGYNGSYYIKDLSLSYKPSIEYAIPSVANTTYYRSFNSLFREEKEITLDLHSRINGSEQLSLLYEPDATSMDTLYRTTHAEAAKPERFLLDEYQRIYGRALQRWRRGVMMRDVRPIDIFSRTGVHDHRLILTGYTADFDENTISLYLSDVTKVELIHYVN